MHRQCAAGLLGCNVYVSEGRNMQLIRALQGVVAQHRHVLLANTFVDAPYHRTGLTLVSPALAELTAAACAVAELAAASIDLQRHAAAHPRLGSVDHISCHPLGQEATLQQAADLARGIGSRLAAAPLQLPVYYYGAASPSQQRLQDVRRRLGYFAPSAQEASTAAAAADAATPPPEPQQQQQQKQPMPAEQQSWQGRLPLLSLASHPPDQGPDVAAAAKGIVTIGAVPWVVNYNVPVAGGGLAAAKAVARAVSERGGGLPGVEAMALQHDQLLEVACNLLRWQAAGPGEVQREVAAAAARHGLSAQQGYVIGHMPGTLCAMAERHLQDREDE